MLLQPLDSTRVIVHRNLWLLETKPKILVPFSQVVNEFFPSLSTEAAFDFSPFPSCSVWKLSIPEAVVDTLALASTCWCHGW